MRDPWSSTRCGIRDELMTQRIPPPVHENIMIKGGTLSRVWQRWFQNIGNESADVIGKVDKASPAVAGHLAMLTGAGGIADSGKTKPTGTIVGTTDTQDLTNKSYEGITGSNLVDKSTSEDITGAWRISKRPSVTYTATGASLSTSDFGKVIKFDNGASDVTCTLPSVSPGHVDGWFIIMRLGTGRLTIQASDSDTIEKSKPGGQMFCQESGRVVANLTLYLATETKWGIIGGTGIWNVV